MSNSKSKSAQNKVSHELLEMERDGYKFGLLPPILTLTWFKGYFREAKIHLELRLRHMIEKNPWLQGRIITQGKSCRLTYPSSFEGVLDIHENIAAIEPEESPISRDMPIEDFSPALSEAFEGKLFLKNGTHEPLFKVFILPCYKNPKVSFALFVQMSHVAGDGATYYKLLDMLCSTDDNSITKLEVERVANSKELQIEVMGKDEEAYPTSMKFMVRTLTGIIASVCIGKLPSIKYSYVDPLKIKYAKEEAITKNESSVRFVSTNDVIASWFMKQSECSIGMMPINWRDRLEGITELHAGNYDQLLIYKKKDFASPVLMRQSLTDYKRAVTKNEKLPGWMETFTTTSSIVTNWTTFSRPNKIIGCQEDIHLPILQPNFLPKSLSVLIIYRAGEGKTGLAYLQHPGGKNLLDSCPFCQ